MNKFIYKCFLFGSIIFILFLIIDIFISEKLKKSHVSPGEIEVWNDIYNGNINSELLIYGSSRAWVHVDPFVIEDSLNISSYNFGMDGQNFELQYLRHKINLKYNKKPKIIIACVDIFSFQNNKDLYCMNQFLPFMLFDKDIYKFTSKYNGFRKVDYFLPLFRYYGKIYGENSVLNQGNQKNNFRNKGYKGIKREWTDDFEKAKLKSKKLTIQNDVKIINMFDEFLAECKDKNIKVILIYTPEFIEGQKYVNNREDVVSLIEIFSKKYNINFLNYSDNAICYDKSNFYNATHLNSNGSLLFSRKLVYDLKAKL